MAELDPKLPDKGHFALARLEAALSSADYLVANRLTLADIALVAYSRVADEGGFELDRYPFLLRWIARVEQALDIGG